MPSQRADLRPRLVWVVVGIAVAAVLTIVVSRPLDPYPMPEGPGASMSNPTAVGKAVQGVVVFMEIRPGDRIELIGAEPVGLLAGAQITLYLSRPVVAADGTRNVGVDLEPLAGAVIEVPAEASPGPDNTVGIVGELTPDRPGIYEMTAVRLRFRINGGAEQVREGMSVIWTVCADDPAPTTCEPPTP